MESHQFHSFLAVALAGNFGRAAERCHVWQPSLSQQLLKLERRLGQPLVSRLGDRAVLMAAGRVLLDRAPSILAAVEDAKRRLRAGDQIPNGRLAIGAIPMIASTGNPWLNTRDRAVSAPGPLGRGTSQPRPSSTPPESRPACSAVSRWPIAISTGRVRQPPFDSL